MTCKHSFQVLVRLVVTSNITNTAEWEDLADCRILEEQAVLMEQRATAARRAALLGIVGSQASEA